MEKEYSYFTAEEFVKSLSVFSNLDMKRLMSLSEKLCLRYDLGCEGGDIFQESVERIIAGDRKIPKELPIIVGIYGVLKSVADSILKSKSEISRKQSSSLDDDTNLHIKHAISNLTSPTSEEEEEEESISEQKWQIVFKSFEGDEEVLQLLGMLANGIKATEITNTLFDGDKNKYNSTYKRFMRKRIKLQQEVTSI